MAKDSQKTFFQIIADCKTLSEAKTFLSDFMSRAELETFGRRLEIIRMLSEGASYVEIRKKLKVSSATIASTAQLLETSGIKLAVDKMKTDEWAEKVLTRILG